jgi:hypothetical protein
MLVVTDCLAVSGPGNVFAIMPNLEAEAYIRR